MKLTQPLCIFLVPALAAALAGCAGTQDLKASSGVASPSVSGERLEWSSAPQRPAWTMSEPETEGGYMYFVGISGNLATEQLARNDALRDSTNKVVAYMGTLAKDKFERARTSFGLASTVVDPTEASREFERQLAANVAKQLKPKEWYGERWTLPTGTAWKYFVLARMPDGVVAESLSNTADDNIRRAQEQARASATEQAKQQAADAEKFWKQMKDQGLTD